jgi:uncharacterized protein (TIGR02611 family)
MPLSRPVEPLAGTTDPARLPDNKISLFRLVRRIVVFILGMSVLLVGIVMIVAPGPAIVVIPLALGILATEFLWARRVLDTLKQRLADAHSATSQANLPRWLRFFMPKKNGSNSSTLGD